MSFEEGDRLLMATGWGRSSDQRLTIAWQLQRFRRRNTFPSPAPPRLSPSLPTRVHECVGPDLRIRSGSRLPSCSWRSVVFSLVTDHRLSFLCREGISNVSDSHGEIPSWFVARVEVLVDLALAGREDHAMAPFDAGEILVAFIPQERVSVAGDADHMRARPVPVGFFCRFQQAFPTCART